MAASIDDVIKRIEDSGLLSEAELSAVREDARTVDGDSQKLVRLLVKNERLTAYQAQAIWKDKGHKLSFGNYLVESELGRGGMGVVLKARHKRMKRHVAIKVLPAQMTSNADAIARFQREVEAAAQLAHTNIVGAHDADEIDGQHFLVMEYVDGRDLSSVVKGNGPLPIDQAVKCVIQAARGLEFAHQRGVIHRDIKPANLLLDNEGTVKILDMGLARFSDTADVDTQAELTGTGTVMGTVDYMSPEQALNTKTADARSDIYSLGITLYYLLVARPAYKGDTMMARLLAHANQPIPSLRDSRPDIAEPIQSVFEKMVAKQADDRYQSMTEVVADLERCQGDGAASSVNVAQLQSQPQTPSGPSELSNLLAVSAPTLDEVPATTPPQVDNHAPTVITQASADDPVVPTVVTPPASVDSGPPTINTDTPTIVTSSLSNTIQTGTIQHGSGADSKAGRPAWMPDKRILGGIGGAVLLLIVIAALAFKSDPVPDPSDEKVASTSKGQSKASSASTDQTEPQEKSGTATLARTPVEPEFALEFDGDDYVSVPMPDEPVGDEYTVEAWVEIEERPDQDNYTGVILQWAGESNVILRRYRVGDKANGITGSHHMEQGYFTASADPFPGRKHVAVVYRDQKISMFVDGQRTKKTRHDRNAGHRYSGAALLTIGAETTGPEGKGDQNFFTGRIDEMRVSSVARYEDDFQPKQWFDTDDDTLALYHFDEGQGDVLKDSSGNDHDGKIVGATWVKAGKPDIAEP